MRVYAAIFLALSLSLAAAEKPPAKVPAAAAKTARPRGLPADARQIEPGIWEVRNADGSASRFRVTPFGLMKLHPPRENAAPARSASERNPLGMGAKDPGENTRVIAEGDSYRFERTTPFGVQRWTRKKSELNEVERQLVENAKKDKAKPAPSQTKKEQTR